MGHLLHPPLSAEVVSRSSYFWKRYDIRHSTQQADWNKIGEFRQAHTYRSVHRENKRRYDFDYEIGGKILIRKDGKLHKAETLYEGSYTITQVHTNGTIRVRCSTKSERLDIMRVKPYHPHGESDSDGLSVRSASRSHAQK